ncbi:SUKH-3 domain-containing protein [Streptomyces desertarenae]|uniref:SUKH-3 domain-containing protein n=1 Tax=Streptomyces desertarenae TaxID=2666184 RepID=A0ABW4PM15_9ACTN
MKSPLPRQEVESWLRRYGWSPERDVGAEADALIRKAREQAAEYGISYAPSGHARAFVRNYGGLKILLHESPENYFLADPGFPCKGGAEEIGEFSRELGEELFPVGYDSYDGAVMLVDGRGRFFVMHHTGNYYLADEALQAVWNFKKGDTQDAEDFCV